MDKSSRIYIAGHRGLVGSALVRQLKSSGYTNLITRTHTELDLTDNAATIRFFGEKKPEYLFLAAAKVGGILANNSYPAEFIYQNIMIQTNVIHAAWKYGVKRLLFLGSSCIYPKYAEQPMKENFLLTGSLEPTNRPYAIAKISGIEMCWSYNRQYGTKFLSVMPTNLYGPGDNYDPHSSHVIPALIHKFHTAKQKNEKEVIVLGTGKPKREFLYSDDMAEACLFLMNLDDVRFNGLLLGSDETATGRFEPPLINIGTGVDMTIEELAVKIKEIVGFDGGIVFDSSKPDGTPQKLLDVHGINALGWKAKTPFNIGLKQAYSDYRKMVGVWP